MDLKKIFFAVKCKFYKLVNIVSQTKAFEWELTDETTVVPVAGCSKKLNGRFGRGSVITWSMHCAILAKAKRVKDRTSTFAVPVKRVPGQRYCIYDST